MKLSERLSKEFASYSEYHQTPGNKFYHKLGIPLITVSTLGLLARVRLLEGQAWGLDLGLLLWILASVYYLYMSPLWGLLFSLVTLALYVAGLFLPMPVLVVFFVLGWVFQFIEHYRYEKKSPAFLTNLKHLLIGPLWVFFELVAPQDRK